MRGIPWRLPYWPCDRRPIDSPASRSSLVSWSESNDSATAQRAPPCHAAGRSDRPARTRSTIARQRSSGHCQGACLVFVFHWGATPILRARSVMNADSFATNRAKSSGVEPTASRP